MKKIKALKAYFTHFLFAATLMEGLVTFFNPQNRSGALWRDTIPASANTVEAYCGQNTH